LADRSGEATGRDNLKFKRFHKYCMATLCISPDWLAKLRGADYRMPAAKPCRPTNIR
jgi:hypothetical protein